ncbi:MAG: copper transporter [Marmoricola sp.]
MISFRYHIVSLVSVFLALAVGIALGGGPLKGGVDNSLVQDLAARKKVEHEQQLHIAELRASSAFSDSYAQGTAPKLLAGTLKGVSVAVVALPDAQRAMVTSLSSLVHTAGGRVVGSYRVGTKLSDDGNKGLVDQLGTQMQVDAPDVNLPDNVSTYQRFGFLVGRAIGIKDLTGSSYDVTSTNLVSGFSTAGLFSAVGQPKRRADVVVVVTGAGANTDRQAAINKIHAIVADSLASYAETVVLAGPADGARAGGLIRKVRDDSALAGRLSTVDSADTGPGGVVTMLAIAQDLAQGTGHYGAVDAADGPVPVSTTG